MATQTQVRNVPETFQSKPVPGQTANALQPYDDLYKYFQEYARERPDVVAMWCFGIGFVLGWKLKPW